MIHKLSSISRFLMKSYTPHLRAMLTPSPFLPTRVAPFPCGAFRWSVPSWPRLIFGLRSREETKYRKPCKSKRRAKHECDYDCMEL
jgi:hypothetical protein